jgi:hypothetical protein
MTIGCQFGYITPLGGLSAVAFLASVAPLLAKIKLNRVLGDRFDITNHPVTSALIRQAPVYYAALSAGIQKHSCGCQIGYTRPPTDSLFISPSSTRHRHASGVLAPASLSMAGAAGRLSSGLSSLCLRARSGGNE